MHMHCTNKKAPNNHIQVTLQLLDFKAFRMCALATIYFLVTAISPLFLHFSLSKQLELNGRWAVDRKLKSNKVQKFSSHQPFSVRLSFIFLICETVTIHK